MELNLVEDMKSLESRTLASKPTLKLDELYDYLSKYDNYFNDNYGLRNMLFCLNVKIKYLLLNKNPLPKEVIIGKNDWLFISPDQDITITDKLDYLNPDMIKMVEDSFVSKTKRFEKAGMKYYILLTPEKSYTYSELLPSNYNSERIRSRFDFLVNKLQRNPNLHVININKVLLEAKKKDIISLQYDTHWNGNGAMAAYRHVMKELKKEYSTLVLRDETDYTKKCFEYKWGDLANQIGISKYIVAKEYRYSFIGTGALVDTAAYSIKSNDAFAHTHPENKNMPDILFLHDSYGNSFMPWMINDFHEFHSFRITDFKFDPNLFTKAAPKLVLHQMVLRHTPYFELLISKPE